jgi:hypothetical protein
MGFWLLARIEIAYIFCCVYICFDYVNSVGMYELKSANDDNMEHLIADVLAHYGSPGNGSDE